MKDAITVRLRDGLGILNVARKVGMGNSTVQRVKAAIWATGAA